MKSAAQINFELSERVLRDLAERGVSEYCLCAGARNSPLVFILARAQGVRIFHFFEERSAAFFAIGRIKATQRPVAVVTTSGTAVAELLPAAIEATYAGLPLVLVTADRPRSYRGKGAPQAIEQAGIFSDYVEACWDLDSGDEFFETKTWSGRQPLHLNLCFDEPLILPEIPKLSLAAQVVSWPKPDLIAYHSRELKKPLILVGPLKEQEVAHVAKFLEGIEAPIYAESPSQLRGIPGLQNKILKSGEKIIPKLFREKKCQSLFRVGGVPTLRFWRDLEDQFIDVPVLSCSNEDWTGLSRPAKHTLSLDHLDLFEIEGFTAPELENIFDQDFEENEKLEVLLEKYPRSETSLLWHFAKTVRADKVYLGNSLPIREWDLVSAGLESLQGTQIQANRGANGIDGQLSTFLGWSENPDLKHECWALVGDLTSLYDLASLWIAPQLSPARRRILVINNQGGQIFRNLFQEKAFLNSHQLNFKAWSEQWSWGYQVWEQIPEIMNFVDHQVIELKPDATSSEHFWKEYRSL